MTTIKKDMYGLYIDIGWICRPVVDTKYQEGDKVKAHHFGGSKRVGIDKLPGRGNYQEYWSTTICTWDYVQGIVGYKFGGVFGTGLIQVKYGEPWENPEKIHSRVYDKNSYVYEEYRNKK